MTWTTLRLWLIVGMLAPVARLLVWTSRGLEASSRGLERIIIRHLERTRELP